MSRPVRNLASPPGVCKWSAPDWDPKAVGADYLLELREAAERGPIDGQWLAHLNGWLAHELRQAYAPEQAQLAMSRLEPLIAELERKGLDVGKTNERLAADPAISPRAEPVSPVPQPAATAMPLGRLNGGRLQKSILPTWLALVALSWLSLVWGGLISAPFGVGGAILGGAVGGIVAVPLWASIFGFLGMSRARDATLRDMEFEECPADDPLSEAAREFAKELSIPVPKIGIINVHNAFAMGARPESATVAMGLPLMQMLSEDETLAVLGHEMGHVISGDMRRMMLMRTFQNATVWYMVAQGAKQFARWCICWGAELFILAFSRKREFWADAVGAALTSKEAMIGALRKLEAAPSLTPAENTHARFMFRGRVNNLFSTHPTMQQRIAALEQETYLRRLPRQ